MLDRPWPRIHSADRNWTRNAAISRIVRETLKEMAPKCRRRTDGTRRPWWSSSQAANHLKGASQISSSYLYRFTGFPAFGRGIGQDLRLEAVMAIGPQFSSTVDGGDEGIELIGIGCP